MGDIHQMILDNPQQAETIWAYMAGIIDGEGCISVAKYSTAKTYYVHVIIVQKHEAIPVWLMKNICSSRKVDRVKRQKGFKDGSYWRWYVAGKDALFVLEKCLPYLVEKKNQAELAIELLRSKTPLKKQHTKGIVGCTGEKPHILKRQAEIYDLVKRLKQNRAVAETEAHGLLKKRSDSPNCKDDKLTEVAEMTIRPTGS
jgi:hypothetical protein